MCVMGYDYQRGFRSSFVRDTVTKILRRSKDRRRFAQSHTSRSGMQPAYTKWDRIGTPQRVDLAILVYAAPTLQPELIFTLSLPAVGADTACLCQAADEGLAGNSSLCGPPEPHPASASAIPPAGTGGATQHNRGLLPERHPTCRGDVDRSLTFPGVLYPISPFSKVNGPSPRCLLPK